jgi:hypothetical protein
MSVSIKTLVVSAAVAVSASAIALPALAETIRPTNIQFFTNDVAHTAGGTAPNLNTWTYSSSSPLYDSTGIGGINRRVLNDFSNYGNTTKAAAALSDNDSATNVELWTQNRTSSDRTIYDHVGFTAMFGDQSVKVESVTKADWADGVLANSWLTGFRNAYGGVMQTIATTPGSNLLMDFNNNFSLFSTYLSANGFNELGDANIGGISFDDQTRQLKLDMVGHLDAAGRYVDTRATIVKSGVTIANSNYRKKSPDFARNTTGNTLLDNALFSIALKSFDSGQKFQTSEVAKVTIDDKVNYAFSFVAVESGAIAGDRSMANDKTSHTGIYSWSKTVPRKVPEPTMLFGFVAVCGAIARRKKQ